MTYWIFRCNRIKTFNRIVPFHSFDDEYFIHRFYILNIILFCFPEKKQILRFEFQMENLASNLFGVRPIQFRQHEFSVNSWFPSLKKISGINV